MHVSIKHKTQNYVSENFLEKSNYEISNIFSSVYLPHNPSTFCLIPKSGCEKLFKCELYEQTSSEELDKHFKLTTEQFMHLSKSDCV